MTLALITWLRWYLLAFSTIELTIFSLKCLGGDPVSPLILASLSGSCLQLLLVWCSNGYFLVPYPSAFIKLQFFCKEKLSLLPHLFFQLLISVYTHEHLVNYTFHSVSYNSTLLLFIFLFKLFQVWPSGALSGPILFLVTLLWYTECSRLMLSFPCPS